ncbi:MAG: hypothetical protein MUC34_11165, partial [Anaerolineae bacterium]|nr:hypothetical protein [Anaerolineae bacterium]
MINVPTLNLLAILPQITLVAAALILLLLDLVIRNKRVLAWFSLVVILGTLAETLFVRPATPEFQGMAL